MPTTSIEGPHNAGNVGTDIGDGVNYASISATQMNRVKETSTGASAMAATATPSGAKFFNFFNASQIPSDATILGVEVVFGTDFDGSGEAYIGSFGSSGGTFDVECYLHNGTAYSSKLVWVAGAQTGITLSAGNDSAEFSGGNKRYVNTTSGDDVGFGGTSDLSGLSWNPANQADFGFAITFQNESSAMVAGILRGVGLRVTYSVFVDPPPTYSSQINSIILNSGNVTITSGNIFL